MYRLSLLIFEFA